MSPTSPRIFCVRNGIPLPKSMCMKQGVAAAFTAFCSKHSTAGFSSPIILRRVAGAAAVVAPAPATLRPCYSASADSDIVELQLKVDGMVCDGCSSRVLEALQKISGVKSVHVDLEKGLATLEISATSQVDAFNELPKFIDTVKELGFEAEPFFG